MIPLLLLYFLFFKHCVFLILRVLLNINELIQVYFFQMLKILQQSVAMPILLLFYHYNTAIYLFYYVRCSQYVTFFSRCNISTNFICIQYNFRSICFGCLKIQLIWKCSLYFFFTLLRYRVSFAPIPYMFCRIFIDIASFPPNMFSEINLSTFSKSPLLPSWLSSSWLLEEFVEFER